MCSVSAEYSACNLYIYIILPTHTLQYYVVIYNILIYINAYTAVLYTLKIHTTHRMYTNDYTAPDSVETLNQSSSSSTSW